MVRQLHRFLAAAALAVVALFGAATLAHAEEYTCTGTVGAVTLDNIRVPDNATCTLNGTKAEGTIYVQNNATLLANGVNVNGNVQADNAARVEVLANSRVGGSVQLKQGGSARVETAQVNGDVQFESNSAALSARWNDVGGNVQIFQNTGGVAVFDNTIDGNLQCKENAPAPTGGRNVVLGSAEDQCASFTGTPQPPGPQPPPPSDDFNCTGTLGAATYENIRVPDNATCTLNGTRAQGNVLVGSNATLIARGVDVDGNIQADNARHVDVLANSRVGGSVQLKQGGSARVETAKVVGDIQLESNGAALSARWNDVGGNIQIFQNKASAAVYDNTVDGNLQCKENAPAPAGGRNAVLGSAEDQCAAFEGTPLPLSPSSNRRFLPFIGR